jgi:hypothetical protein
MNKKTDQKMVLLVQELSLSCLQKGKRYIMYDFDNRYTEANFHYIHDFLGERCFHFTHLTCYAIKDSYNKNNLHYDIVELYTDLIDRFMKITFIHKGLPPEINQLINTFII